MRPSASQSWLLDAPDWILNGPEWLYNLGYDIYKSFIYDNRYQMYIKGLGNTLLLTFLALLIGVVLGVIVSLIRVSWGQKSYGDAGHGQGCTGFLQRRCQGVPYRDQGDAHGSAADDHVFCYLRLQPE